MLRDLLRRLAARLRGEQSIEILRARGVSIGDNVFLGDRISFDMTFPWLITIGSGSVVCAGTRILTHDASLKRHIGYTLIAPVEIAEKVYVGADSLILPGVTIGRGSIVGAASVVTRSVEPGVVVAGVPARVIRTTQEHIERAAGLMESRPKWTSNEGVDEGSQRRIRDELASGPGYVP